ncbi:MAG: transcription factor [Hyphomonas sp. BRH_c22]|uniref:type II toxin-antitoxin system VapB family antitoxin n=1 Tax=Hyphomonas sp. BRH_c22 TaxID=1629710 RepID=UPI0005F19C4A|nr:type II toxin-antitoxin system VapB family antitoxin [Hyphomonas sp. BRH_c22]KJS36100.1 MAG: transcription factor [Hyphomonas sp. BRH_c22]
MALSIKTEEADRLARQLASLTGETMTEAVTKSLKERLERLRGHSNDNRPIAERVRAFAASIADKYDRETPVTQEEWDEACGDIPDERGF